MLTDSQNFKMDMHFCDGERSSWCLEKTGRPVGWEIWGIVVAFGLKKWTGVSVLLAC